MSDKTIKHFVVSRFFTFQRGGFPYDIFDVNFLQTQLPITRNILSSLENQTNKNFELVFLMNPKFFDAPKYEFIFSTLQDSTTLPIRFVKYRGDTSFDYDREHKCYKFIADRQEKQNPEWLDILKAARNDYDFVITTAMDFDDFVFKDAVKDTQSKVDECENILAYGYISGYRYACGELYPDFYSWGKGRAYHSVFYSLILKSSAVKDIPVFFVKDFWHSDVKIQLKILFKEHGVNFSEKMFQQDLSTKAYIYIRHDFAQEYLVAHKPLKVDEKELTTKDITRKQLEEEFGFTGYELKSIE